MILYPADWRIRLTGAVGGAIGGALALFVVKPRVELPQWLGPFAFVAMIGIGVVLGNLLGAMLFPTPPAGPSDPSTRP
ncbi:MAG: hypothetical protein SFX72_05940 [Isosphaeraceae bacterium]|nr:hypothetical protein [Isosphaeraceae bacterium]